MTIERSLLKEQVESYRFKAYLSVSEAAVLCTIIESLNPPSVGSSALEQVSEEMGRFGSDTRPWIMREVSLWIDDAPDLFLSRQKFESFVLEGSTPEHVFAALDIHAMLCGQIRRARCLAANAA